MLDPLTTQAVAAFMLALLGGLHCAGMCGGFIGALQVNRPRAVPASRLAAGYHLGRVTSYTLAGALVGLIGGQLYAADVLPVQIGLLLIGSAMLLVIGGSLLGRSAWLKRLEPVGLGLWKLIGPLARRVYPPRSFAQASAAGLAWGWIPCGMVYAALPLALVAGGPVQGALVMLAFGLGTLPNLLLVDVAATRLSGLSGNGRGIAALPWLRVLAGAVIVVFGLSGLAHAARVAGAQHPAVETLASICHR
ncbi:MAG: sulfite exporter TauE/SafE family protein [Burkholderiales bacterium]|jgi:sulfite exporter TauE/SafE|nr:sulfite exporter TauE/SafE family protein [Burkholderiales bacterium]